MTPSLLPMRNLIRKETSPRPIQTTKQWSSSSSLRGTHENLNVEALVIRFNRETKRIDPWTTRRKACRIPRAMMEAFKRSGC